MSIDRNVCDAARMLDQERSVGPLEEEVLGAMEKMDACYAAYNVQREELERLYQRVLSAHIYPGGVLDLDARKHSPCLVNFRVIAGADRGARKFSVVEAPKVRIEHDGDPCVTRWIVQAAPLSQKTGKPMSARTHGANSRNGMVTIQGYVFFDTDIQFPEPWECGPGLAQKSRDYFIEFVAECEAILINREKTP